MIPNGDAKVLHRDNVLTRHGHIVAAQKVIDDCTSCWRLRRVDWEQCVMVLTAPGEQDMAATLDTGSDSDGVINIIMRPLESPPSPEQLWSMEDRRSLLRHPPIVYARIQSCAKPDMSMVIAGMVPLPETMQNVACVPTDSVDDARLRWMLDYRED